MPLYFTTDPDRFVDEKGSLNWLGGDGGLIERYAPEAMGADVDRRGHFGYLVIERLHMPSGSHPNVVVAVANASALQCPEDQDVCYSELKVIGVHPAMRGGHGEYGCVLLKSLERRLAEVARSRGKRFLHVLVKSIFLGFTDDTAAQFYARSGYTFEEFVSNPFEQFLAFRKIIDLRDPMYGPDIDTGALHVACRRSRAMHEVRGRPELSAKLLETLEQMPGGFAEAYRRAIAARGARRLRLLRDLVEDFPDIFREGLDHDS